MNTTVKENNKSIVELKPEQLELVAGGFGWEDLLEIFLTGAQGVPD